jgi:predicted Ser/Thr protein kinase
MHPLLLHDADAEEVLFLNARRGRQRTEYLCYTTGRTSDRPDLGGEQLELLARVLGMAVTVEQADQWAAPSHAEEPPDPASRERQRPETPRSLGEFELLSELGRGGMGVVYRAWQPALGRQVALKKLQRTGDAKSEARFAREIRALGRVEHPNLVKIYTSGAAGDDWFYAMELIEGAPLSAVCDRLQASNSSVRDVDLASWHSALSTACEEARKAEKALRDTAPEPAAATRDKPKTPADTPGQVRGRDYVRHTVELMARVAEAAHALHEAGVIHRDIKPGNVMVTADGSQAVLMDLGLAQLADSEEGRLTRTRQFVGTLRYASPEQVLAVARLDRRSDVYSLGGDALGVADAAAAVRRHRADAHAGTDAAHPVRGTGAAAQVPPGPAARPGGGRAEVPGEASAAALRYGPRTGGGTAPLPRP